MPSRRSTGNRPTTYGPRIPPSTWETHLPEIKRLYLEEDKPLAGSDGVLEQMKRLHNFHANEGQYYVIFKKHRISKNMKQREWSKLFAHYDGLEEQERAGVIRFNGRTYTQEQIATARRHHGQKIANCNADTGAPVESAYGLELVTSTRDVFIARATGRLIAPDEEAPHWGSQNIISAYHHRDKLSAQQVFYNVAKKGGPFQWHGSLDWPMIANCLVPHQEWVRIAQHELLNDSLESSTIILPAIYSRQIRSMFWSSPQSDFLITKATREMIAKFMFSTMFNNNTGFQEINLSTTHQWIKNIAPTIVLQFFGRLRQEEMTILRERIFAAALAGGDEITTRLMLSLGSDPWEEIKVSNAPFPIIMRPLPAALNAGHFPVAELLVKQLCHNAANEELSRVIAEIEDTFDRRHIPHCRDYRQCNSSHIHLPQWRDLLHIPLDSLHMKKNNFRSTSLTLTLCLITMGEESLTNRLLDLQRGQAETWLREGQLRKFLERCLNNDPWDVVPTIEKIYMSIADENLGSNFISQPEFQYILQTSTHQGSWVMALAHNLACKLGLVQFPRNTREGTVPIQPELTALASIINQAIKNGQDDFALTHMKLYPKHKIALHEIGDHFRYALKLDRTKLVLDTIQLYPQLEGIGLSTFMAKGKIAEVSQLIFAEEQRGDAVKNSVNDQSYQKLEDLLFRNHDIGRRQKRNVVLRAIACHAIYTNDSSLLQFALQCNVNYEECIYNELYDHLKPVKRSQNTFENLQSPGKVILPSLLAVAGALNQISMIQTLVDEGVEMRDPSALQYALKHGAAISTIDMLLDAAVEAQPPYKTKGYGMSAICEAVRRKDYEMLKHLIRRTDLNGISDELLSGELNEPTRKSALGEAIFISDYISVRILLNNGADVNGLVALGGFSSTWSKPFIARVTPILAAIETADMEMLRLLVERGALIGSSSQRGLTRSPLQRAAEVGNFEAVEYLLEMGASVDFNGIYMSGTALQFAAIGGYVGIARLLLRHGADPNAMPAEGSGRTAFEGAAEWGRPDMISLLIVDGVHPELPVGENREPQAARAIRFAKENGHKALMRYIEGLWAKYKQQQATLQVLERIPCFPEDIPVGFDSSIEWATAFVPRDSLMDLSEY